MLNLLELRKMHLIGLINNKMKLEIDFKNKTIQIRSEVNISEFFNELHEILGDEIDNYKLIPSEVVYNFPTYNPINDLPIQPYYGTGLKPYFGEPSTCKCNNH